MALNIVFAGTPDFAAAHLQALLNSEHNVIAVYSQPDRPAGRGRKLTASPVKALAQDAGLPVYQPLNFKEASSVEALQALNADLMVVVAYGLILPQVVLDAPRLGCVNVHASLLPRWRGAAPIHRALLAGDKTTGVTIMQMDAGLDTGAMLVKAECAIESDDTSQTLHDRLIDVGGPALITALNQLEVGSASPEPQDNALACYASKLEKSEGLIDWNASAEHIDRHIRGLTPWPGAYTQWQGQNLRIHKAHRQQGATDAAPGDIIDLSSDGLSVATGDGILRIDTLQLPGKKAMAVGDVLNARREQFVENPRFGE